MGVDKDLGKGGEKEVVASGEDSEHKVHHADVGADADNQHLRGVIAKFSLRLVFCALKEQIKLKLLSSCISGSRLYRNFMLLSFSRKRFISPWCYDILLSACGGLFTSCKLQY